MRQSRSNNSSNSRGNDGGRSAWSKRQSNSNQKWKRSAPVAMPKKPQPQKKGTSIIAHENDILKILTYTTTTTTTEKIDWNRSPKTISSEWIWSPPVSPQKEKEEEEIEELKLPAVSPSNSNKADVKSLTKEMGSLEIDNGDDKKKKKKDVVVEKKEDEPKTEAKKTPAKSDDKKEEKKKTDTKTKKTKKLRANAPEFKLRSSAPAFTPGGYRPRPQMPATNAPRPQYFPGMQHHYRMPMNPQTGKPMTPQEYHMMQMQYQQAAMMAQQQRNARPYRPQAPPQ